MSDKLEAQLKAALEAESNALAKVAELEDKIAEIEADYEEKIKKCSSAIALSMLEFFGGKRFSNEDIANNIEDLKIFAEHVLSEIKKSCIT